MYSLQVTEAVNCCLAAAIAQKRSTHRIKMSPVAVAFSSRYVYYFFTFASLEGKTALFKSGTCSLPETTKSGPLLSLATCTFFKNVSYYRKESMEEKIPTFIMMMILTCSSSCYSCDKTMICYKDGNDDS